MITISLCMIVKNEEHTLEKCLKSIKDVVDEIIIVDTGSTDKTKKIARKWTDRVYDFSWCNDFSAARNESFSYATMDYILWLDADDILQSGELKKLKELKRSLDPKIDAVSMKYHVAFDENEKVIASTRRVRLIKRSKLFRWVGIVHEDLHCYESFSSHSSDIIVTHTKKKSADIYRNIKIYEKAINEGKTLTRQDLFHYGRELVFHKKYEKAIEVFETCLQKYDIALEHQLFIYHQLATCYALIGNLDKEKEITFQSFQLDIPQPVFCCRMGEQFLQENKYEQAAFWYDLATKIELPSRYEWTVSQEIYQTWLPHQQLAFCYYYMGEYKKSYRHNQKVLFYKPQDENAKKNIKMLEELLRQENIDGKFQ
ncbi:glycosyl transferase [Bacillus thuringiensis serovar pingluonsis]|uniref:Glycosyl transferase n=1 Tax=Bacillus thuringiensis serovar pingluonsis TaxID=180881 RepID=A0A243BIF7_BACTU|nr:MULTISPECIES: glycosyltransferase family 2 protein [Bacillus cereus group]MEB9686074.1 glycosyltransferase family 2 protein [Bacillus anthracis]OPD56239.1 glycosyl transferase [Bacillus anthracis]OTY46724.1 glycosyl transferase [Bacillus thuringiensis serovar pingluonsis]